MNPNGLDPQLLTLLAGAGLPTLLDAVSKLTKGMTPKNPAAPSAQLPHRPGMRIGAAGPPGSTTIAPSMLQALMARGQAPQPSQGQPNPQQLLQLLAQRGGA